MVELISDIINGFYRIFNVTIPGFPISISNIILGLIFLSIIIGIFKKRSDEK